MKHTNQRNVMCPYCQKRFKSKATCRIHLQIHKTEWVKQFKEQLKSGTIQFEEDNFNQTNEPAVMDVMTSSATEGILETLNETTTDSRDESVRNVHENNQILFTDLVQETQVDDSRNQFEYFLLLPSNSETNNIGTSGGIRTETEQFIVNDEQLSFANLQFIQLEQSALLDMENSHTIPLMSNYSQSLDAQLSELDQQIDSNTERMSSLSTVLVPDSEESTINVVATTEPNQIALTNKKSINSRSRKSTKTINKCQTCLKIFQKPIDLRRHIRTHTLEKPFSCNICPKAFGLKSTLQNHIKHKHLNIKLMFPCTVCWKAFSSRHSMITHMLIHSNSRPFKCEYCTTTFRTRGHLKIHQQIHLREGRKLGVNPSDIKTKKEKAKLLPLLNVMREVSESNVVEEFVDQNAYNEETAETVRVERLVS